MSLQLQPIYNYAEFREVTEKKIGMRLQNTVHVDAQCANVSPNRHVSIARCSFCFTQMETPVIAIVNYTGAELWI